MIELLTGENDFELTQAVQTRQAGFDGAHERFEGADITLNQLTDIISGTMLFTSRRLVVISRLSDNANLWNELPQWLERANDQTDIMLVEPKPDKRTATYKWLEKHAQVSKFDSWSSRDRLRAHDWLVALVKEKKIRLTSHQLTRVLDRAGIDQWSLYHAIEKLSLLPEITDELIDSSIPPRHDENVFALLETAMTGDTKRLLAMLDGLKQTEDAYRVFGLLVSQILQLATLVQTNGSLSEVARDMNSGSTYTLQKLLPHAKRLSPKEIRAIIRHFAAADMRLKTTDISPWRVVEQSVLWLASA